MPEKLLQSRIFSVERRKYDDIEGNPIVRDVVVHPGAVAILPILEDGRFVMIRNFRHAPEEELLEIPAGTVEIGEDPLKTAHRELEEEAGYVAKMLEPFLEFYTSPGICTELMQCYVASDLTQTEQNLDAGEQIRVEILEPERVKVAMYDGSIRDGKTIAILGAYFMKQANTMKYAETMKHACAANQAPLTDRGA